MIMAERTDWVVLLKNKDRLCGPLLDDNEEPMHFATKVLAMEQATLNALCRAYGALVVNIETGETDWTY